MWRVCIALRYITKHFPGQDWRGMSHFRELSHLTAHENVFGHVSAYVKVRMPLRGHEPMLLGKKVTSDLALVTIPYVDQLKQRNLMLPIHTS
jgi:hypothetical protein